MNTTPPAQAETALTGTPSWRPLVALCPFNAPVVLYSTTLILVAIHVAIFVVHYRIGDVPFSLPALFDVDREDSVPTWFSTVVLLFGAVLLLAAARAAERRGDQLAGYWRWLAVGFFVLSADEIAGFHETFNADSEGPWTIPAAIVVALVGLVYSRFLLRLPSHLRWRLILAGAMYVGGAIGVEHLADYYIEAYGTDNLGYHLLTAFEEMLEMLGSVALVHTMLLHLEQETRGSPFLLGVVRSHGRT